MKKFLLHHYWLMAFVLAILPTALGAQVSYICNFSPITPQYTDTVIDGLYYRTITLDGMEMTSLPGAPLLPCRILQFSVPYNATDVTVTSVCHNSTTSSLNKYTLFPAPYPRAICDTTLEQVVKDSIIYFTNAYYPTDMADIIGEGFMMGENHIVTVAVYPLQFNPVTRTLKTNPTVSFTISYTLSNSHTNNVLVRNDPLLRQQGWDETKVMVVNSNQVEGFAANGSPAHHLAPYLPDSLPSPEGGFTCEYGGELYTPSSEYMIVTTRNLAHSFRRLAALKRQKGYTVAVRCIEDIVNDPMVQFGDKVKKIDGTYSCINDSAGKLRHYLRLAHGMDRTRFVLFGGQEVPFRYWYDYDPNHIDSNHIPTDWYYSDLTTNWNKNNNDQYGEYQYYNRIRYGSFDYFPELFVGRLMAENEEHINNYTDKLLRYELNPGKGNAQYLKRALLTNGFNENQNLAHLLAPSYTANFPDLETINHPTATYPTGADVINKINTTQYGYLGIHGHGSATTINVNNMYMPKGSFVLSKDSYKTYSHGLGLDSINNKYCPSIMSAISCTTAPFDKYNPDTGIYRERLSMAQSFTLGKDYGGVAYLGNSRYGLCSANNELAGQARLEEIFLNLVATGYYRIGLAETKSKEIKSHEYFYEGFPYHDELVHNLIGEPEFEVWTDEPECYNGINVTRNENSITVSNINSDSATVAISGNATYPQRIITTDGTATFSDVSPNSTVMVYQHNYLPYIAPLFIQNENINRSQYVIASDAYLGRNVNPNRAVGDVTISSGVTYEMEHTGEVILNGGFEVKKGATLTVFPSDY